MFKFRECINKYKKLSKKEKMKQTTFVFAFFGLITFGVMTVYAFYHDNITFPILANKVGNFDGPKGDMSIVLYRQDNEYGAADPVYVRTKTVPQLGYQFNEAKCTKTCSSNQSDSCHYTYDIDQNKFTVTSNERVSCSFYFTKTSEADINIYIMLQDDNGGNTYNGKNYREAESIPAYGYEYTGYSCALDATVTFDPLTKTFNVSTRSINTCYAYFDSNGSADVTVNTYVQSEKNSDVYKLVDSIPTNNVYVLSQKAGFTSACYDTAGNKTDDVITYSGGYITTTAMKKQTCNVYLDLYSGAPLINSLTATTTANSISLTGSAQAGKANISCYQFELEGVQGMTSCSTTPSHTFSGLNSCTDYKAIFYVTDANGAQVGYSKTFRTGGC